MREGVGKWHADETDRRGFAHGKKVIGLDLSNGTDPSPMDRATMLELIFAVHVTSTVELLNRGFTRSWTAEWSWVTLEHDSGASKGLKVPVAGVKWRKKKNIEIEECQSFDWILFHECVDSRNACNHSSGTLDSSSSLRMNFFYLCKYFDFTTIPMIMLILSVNVIEIDSTWVRAAGLTTQREPNRYNPRYNSTLTIIPGIKNTMLISARRELGEPLRFNRFVILRLSVAILRGTHRRWIRNIQPLLYIYIFFFHRMHSLRSLFKFAIPTWFPVSMGSHEYAYN